MRGSAAMERMGESSLMKEEDAMFMRVMSAAILGITVIPVMVEVDVSSGMPQFVIVGFVSGQVREAQDRVRTSLRNIGMALPPKKVTINLAPADVPKNGTRFDLPIAAGILAAAEQIPLQGLSELMIIGELSLDGSINPVTGALPTAILAKEKGVRALLLPAGNVKEASVVSGLTVVGFRHLTELIEFLRHGTVPELPEDLAMEEPSQFPEDFGDIRGQEAVKRAALVSAAGFHNLLMIGPPGSGKTMMARRMPGIMPPLSEEESLEISQIYSIAGLLGPRAALMEKRPFRSPHHTMTAQALAGGGTVPRPGEITLAHRGILFLDEISNSFKYF